MHIAIDDTYGPENTLQSRYTTGQRRTSVGIVFEDSKVEHICQNIRECLKYIRDELGIKAKEFHFTELFNRRGPWSEITDDTNIKIIEAFTEIYYENQWTVHVQTIDKYTLPDPSIKAFFAESPKTDSLDLSDPAHLSLFLLLVKIRSIYLKENIPLTLYVDEGICKNGKKFGDMIFHDWPKDYCGKFESSIAEPLLQIADFVAFSINRMTHLATKDNRTPFDLEVLNLLGSMSINSPDITEVKLARNFTVNDIDEMHDQDRKRKGLPRL